MNRILSHGIRSLVPPIALIIALVSACCCAPPDPSTEEALLTIEAALRMESLSNELWPSWDVSKTPVALLCPDGSCYLVNHPKPPRQFERVRETSVHMSVHTWSSGPEGDRRACRVEGVPTALVQLEDLGRGALPRIFEASFEAHEMESCFERTRPVVLVPGYPVDAGNLALADIECELLLAAVTAPDDSVARKAEEFAGLRHHRRMRMGERYSEYERHIEFCEGVPAYLADRCRQVGSAHVRTRAAELLGDSTGTSGEPCLPGIESLGLEWYRHDRFGWTGALICQLLDRLCPEWKDDVWSGCVDPYEILWRRVEGTTPMARVILARHGYDDLVSGRSSSLEEMKSGAERHFDEIAGGDGQVLAVSTHLLVSGQVTFESASIERVDVHRQVHNRILKIEYSWGTRFECVGAPVAVVLGDDEFDFRRLVLRLPEEYSISLDGEDLVPESGVYQFMESLVLTAPGLNIEAHSGTVMVGENGVSLILHR
ncbi:MAG: hypothetical protein JXB46_00315 [Candidatus Eisenbacteria bacterium]|nr:hypothetical protein [Candidatus Eisenbacteria bacterium]